LDRALERERARAARESWPLAILIIGLDYFKLFNDAYAKPTKAKISYTVACSHGW